MNRMHFQITSIVLFTGALVSCSPSLSTSTDKDYYEDLSVLRPIYASPENTVHQSVELPQSGQTGQESVELSEDFIAEFDITYRLDSLLDSVALNNQQIRYFQGYTIQVYTGNSREEANNAKALVYRILPSSRPAVSYDLPNYKVKVGKFNYRLEAQKDFAQIKREFPTAILVPQQFKID